jgi:hypothetical protein
MKRIKVKWTADYETVIEYNPDEQTESDAIADIDVEVPGSEYISESFDTREVTQLSEGEL